MKRLDQAAEDSVALAKRQRHQEFSWSRIKSGFFKNPDFRVAAEIAGLPLFQVHAIAGGLWCLANESEPRGYVGEFRAATFGAAHGMPAEEAARIYAALEHRDVGWIDQDYVPSFQVVNPDKEDKTAPLRDQRRKARRSICRVLDRKAERGDISEEQREGAAAFVYAIADEELFALQKKLRAGVALEAALSTATGATPWPSVATVVATPRAERSRADSLVDNSGADPRGEAQELSEERVGGAENDPQALARQWIAVEGRRIAIARMPAEQPGRIDTLLERWCDQVLAGDAGALMTVLIECDRLNLVGSQFHVEVSARCEQQRRRAQLTQEKQIGLPLSGVQSVKRAG
jgi:hypothetical protein